MRIAFLVLGLVGTLLVSYGGLREAFRALTTPRPYGEGRYGEGPYGGTPRPVWAAIGTRLRLLPKDRHLTLTDRKRNAICLLVGFPLLFVSLLAEFVWL